jgi:hypothetical protein
MMIDHVTIAGKALAPLQAQFEQAGLKTEYGGPHSNGATHMALLGFRDGSYIELISLQDPGSVSPLWQDAISGDAGPCAWAVDPGELSSESTRISSLGVSIQGPAPLNRRKPDGRMVEWDLAFVGDGQPGSVLPFLIHDRTPRSLRVQPSPSVDYDELIGIARVVLGVADLEPTLQTFQTLYGWSTATAPHNESMLGATLSYLVGCPVILATPIQEDGWLYRRLQRFGALPCAFLVGTTDMAASASRYPLTGGEQWFGQEVRWIDPRYIGELRLGFIET